MIDNPYATLCSPSSSGGENLRDSPLGLKVVYNSMDMVQNMFGVGAAPPTHDRRSLSPKEFHQIEIGSMCAICLEDMDEEEEVFTIPLCKHKFHESCVRRWKKEKVTCPTCRGVMPEELGPTDDHIWIGNYQLTINARPPPDPTFCYILWTILFTPIGIPYSLLVVLLIIVSELLLFILMIFVFLVFAQWYAWVETGDIGLCGRICHSITSIVLFPFVFLALLLLWIWHLSILLGNLGSFFWKVMSCQCRWTDTISATFVPALRRTQGVVQTFLSAIDSDIYNES